MTRFAFDPIYGSIIAAALCAVAIVTTIALIAPPTPKPSQRRWLIILRSAAALLLLLTAFGPSLIRTDKKPADATLFVAADVSKSMTLSDGEGSDRWTTQVSVWKSLSKGLAKLDESLHIQLLAYDANASSIVTTQSPEQTRAAANALDSTKPDGDATHLASAIEAAIQESAGQPMAGVIMMGDGTQTIRADLDENEAAFTGAEEFAEMLDALGIPFWTVPIGPPRSENQSRDVGIDSLPEVFQLFSGNQFSVPFQLSLRGLANTEIPLEIKWLSSDGKETVAAERIRSTQKADDVLGQSISLTAPAPGAYRLTVSAKAQEGEWVTANNSQTAFVEIREGGGRILYLEGAQRPEQTYISRSLKRFPDLELTFQWIRPNQKWPVDLGNLFSPGKIDIFILGDLDATALGTEQLTALQERVSDGSALIALGGFQSYEAGGYATSPLAKVLPIQMRRTLRRNPTGDPTTNPELQISGPVMIELSKSHPVTDIGGETPDEYWKKLSPLSGANRILKPKIATGVQVLLQTPDRQPLLVVGEHGRGRVACLAFDETYRWWRRGNSEVTRRFWRQLMLWAMSREETGDEKVIVELDNRRFEGSATPEFTARVASTKDTGKSVPLIAEVIDANDQITPAPSKSILSSDNQSSLAGQIPELTPGFYRLRVRPQDESSKIEAGEVAFQVIETSRELARPMADPVYLKQLSDLTADHGGASFRPDQVSELLEQIALRRKKAESPIVEKNRLGDGPISGWIVFLLFAAALGLEWYLRRRWSLA